MEGRPGQLTCHEGEQIGLEGARTFLRPGTEVGPGDLGSERVLCLDCGDPGDGCLLPVTVKGGNPGSCCHSPQIPELPPYVQMPHL